MTASSSAPEGTKVLAEPKQWAVESNINVNLL